VAVIASDAIHLGFVVAAGNSCSDGRIGLGVISVFAIAGRFHTG
jgi:hypothetical protein